MSTAGHEQYIPVSKTPIFRRQAFTVWAIALAIVGLWVLAIVLAPMARSGGMTAVATPLYIFFSAICHQIAERSFHIHGEQFAVCSRCFGVYFGLAAGFVIYPLIRRMDNIEPLPRIWLFLSLIPIGIDWSLGMLKIWENTHLSRFTTGLILGVACAVFIIPALVEIARNFSLNRKRA